MIKLSCSVTYEHSMVTPHYAAYAIPLVRVLKLTSCRFASSHCEALYVE
jgi:hypothetical protein